MNRVKYAYDFFKHLKSFDILPYQEVVNLYTQTQTHLDSIIPESKKSKNTNDRPINSDIEPVKKGTWWDGFPPKMFNVDTLGLETVNAKSDTTSMDMRRLNKSWDHWIYFTLPYEFVKEFQVRTGDSEYISTFRRFMRECISNNLNNEQVIKLREKYDKELYRFYPVETWRPKWPSWRHDLFVGQFYSIWKQGIIYPIAYNSDNSILRRGTHRSFMLAHTDSDVPIFLQYPVLGGKPIDKIWEIKIFNTFGGKTMWMEPDFKNKKLKFFNNKKDLVFES